MKSSQEIELELEFFETFEIPKSYLAPILKDGVSYSIGSLDGHYPEITEEILLKLISICCGFDFQVPIFETDLKKIKSLTLIFCICKLKGNLKAIPLIQNLFISSQ